MSSISRTPSLTPSRSPSPEPPIQPDHFYGADDIQLPPSPDSDGKIWLDPNDDPFAHRGIPVFKPSMNEFEDFEAYMSRIECWGTRSGIVKVIPPKEWADTLPPLTNQLAPVKIKTPIEQHMLGRGGLFRQENIEKRRVMSVREWAELCGKDEYRAPSVNDVGLHARSANVKPKSRRGRKKVKAESAEPGPETDAIEIKEELVDDEGEVEHADDSLKKPPLVSPPTSVATPATPLAAECDANVVDADPAETENGSIQPFSAEDKQKSKAKRSAQTRESREASLAERVARDTAFLKTFDPHLHWLPPNTKAADYTPEFCQRLERHYWRNCGLSKPAWYGADTQGSLYTDETKSWNVAHLPSTLSRLLPASCKGLPGVNTPYLYFGMWRATFAWHVEDMDLFSINYIHFGAPKFWYAIPQGRAGALEQTMRGYFPKDTSQCPQFLRHKSFLASPTLLAQSSCKPNCLVQRAGEFVITFPRGYHAGFNLGFNCAESVNFALDSWLELGKRAKACECVTDSVRIDVEQLLKDRALEAEHTAQTHQQSSKLSRDKDSRSRIPHKRKLDGGEEFPKSKKIKKKPSAGLSSKLGSSSKISMPKVSITLKLGPKPAAPEVYPCCLCVSMGKEGLLRVHDLPIGRRDQDETSGSSKVWMAHENCADVVPETWVDEIDIGQGGQKERVVFGVDGIVKDRWNLKCSACTKSRPKAHGAPIQCTKGKCPKAFHVSCARDGKEAGIVFSVLREVEKEVVLLDPGANSPINRSSHSKPVDSDKRPADSNEMNIDGMPPAADAEVSMPGAQVLKVIKKVEVQVLCTQHNPAVAVAKKASKLDRIRNDLMSLPNMARIKIRVSAGVFEVSLIRVIEETKSVEVLWDRGVKREFKWGSVVFGSTDGPVQQKPSEVTSESQQKTNVMSGSTYPSVFPATAPPPAPPHAQTQPAMIAAPTLNMHQYTTTPYLYPPRAGAYDYWPFQGHAQYSSSTQPPPPYPYNGYYRTPSTMAGSSHYGSYGYSQNQYRGGQLHWQQPYQGPRPSVGSDYYRPDQVQPPAHPQSEGHATQTQPSMYVDPSQASDSASASHPPSAGQEVSGTSTLLQASPMVNSVSTSAQTPSSPGIVDVDFKDLSALASLQPSQIVDIFRDHPEFRDAVESAVSKTKES